MARIHRLLAVGVLAWSACGKDGPKFADGGAPDANGYDAQVVDTTPPDTAITAQPSALTHVALAHFEFTSTEDGSTFACSIDGAASTACTSPFEMTMTEGVHAFSVVATDRSGNVDPTPATASWTVDLTPPDTMITKSPPALDNSVDVELDFTSEPGATFECSVDGGAYASCTSPDLLTGLADGPHTFDVRATDTAGNVDPTPAEATWTIDTSTPDTVIDSGPTGVVPATTATFTFHSPNAGSGATFKCKLDAAAFAACNTGTVTYNGLAEGDHTFEVEVTNAAGTTDPTPATQMWTVDHTPPTIAIDPPTPADPTNATSAAFTFHSPSDAGATYTCSLDGAAYGACTSPTSYSGLAGGAGTSHTFAVKASDAAGNTSAPATFTWVIDTQAPTTTITSGPTSLTNLTGATFTFTANESPATFQCSVDGGAFGACTSPKSYGGLPDGAHTFAVKATDAAGNTGAAATWTWSVDTTGASVVIDAPTPTDPTNQTTATFTFHSPSDPAATFQCAIDGGAFATCASGQMYTGLAGGAGTAHTFQVKAIDSAGNPGSPVSFTWTIDTQAPTIAIDPPTPANPTNQTTATFTFHSPSDANATYQCHVDTAAYAACTSGKTFSGLAGGAGTAHSFHVRAIDVAGNVSAGVTFNWTIDTQAPTVTLDSTPAAITNSTSASFAFHSADGGTSYECALDTGAFAACTSPQAYAALAGGSGTSHTFQVRATDDAGNVGAPTSYTWTVDTQGPTVVIDPPTPADPTNATTAAFAFHSADGGVSFLCSIDGGAFGACTSAKTYTSLSGATQTGTSHTFAVKSTDAAGNTGVASSFSWVVDTTAPTVTITAQPANPTSSTTASFSFSANEPGTFECALDGGAFASCTSGKTYTGLSGAGQTGTSHTFQVRATDTAGNLGNTAGATWTIDTTSPTVTITSTPPNPTNSTTGAFSFSSNEAGSTFQCSIDGGAFSACASGKTYTGLSGATQTGTSHTFQVRVTDTAGNLGNTAAYTWTIDTTSPTVTITAQPANPTNSTSASFSFSANEPGTFQCQLDGGGFSACTSSKTYTALSGAGQTGTSHTFQVKVTDTAGNPGNTAGATWTIDTTAPNTTIGSQPPNPSASPSATFTFTANETSTFTCQLDANAPTACNSGTITYNALSNASHTFSVFATDTAGNPDASPSTVTWVVNSGPPTLTQVPPSGWTVNYFPFGFTGPLSGVGYQCSTDGGVNWVSCTSTFTATNATYGVANPFAVRWVDTAGNHGSSASTTWTPNQGLVLYYPFDTDAKNYSILEYPTAYYSHDGTNAPSVIQGGYAGGAAAFLSSTKFTKTPMPLQSGVAYTVSMWLLNDGKGIANPVWSNRAPNMGGCQIRMSGNTLIVDCFHDNDPTGQAFGTVSGSIPTNRWTNVTVRFNGTGHGDGKGGNVDLFISGNLWGSIDNSKNGYDLFSPNQAVAFSDMFSNNDTPFVDELSVYNTVYDDATQCAVVMAGTWSGQNCILTQPGIDQAFEGTLLNTGLWATSSTSTPIYDSGAYGKSAEPPGDNSVIIQGLVKNLDNNPDHTISLWYFADGSGNTTGILFNFLSAGAGMRADLANGVLTVTGRVIDPASGKVLDVPVTASSPPKVWHNLTIAVDGTQLPAGGFITPKADVYLDRKLVGSMDFSSVPSGDVFRNTSDSFTIGPRLASQTRYVVDELKIWGSDVLLSGSEAACKLPFGSLFIESTGACVSPQPPAPF